MMVLWLKFIHVGAICLWSAGLVALPLLYRQRRGLSGEPLFRLHAFTRFFYVAIVSPAAFVAIASGTVLILLEETYANWFSAKLVMVAVMTGIHIFSGLMILKLFEPHGHYPAWRSAVMITLTVLVIATILALVLGKPRLVVPEALVALFAPGALSELASRFIGGVK